jgi:LDH2 family malate/lactate/ureidoglycolate dehydrogenase
MSQSKISISELGELVETIFLKSGLNDIQAAALTRVIVAGERDACKSHGIYRIEGALRTVKAGKVDPKALPELHAGDGTGVVTVNARRGFANPAFEMGLPVLADRAKALGVAAMVINDCAHFSALWPEVEAITKQGLVAMVMCPSYATVAPTGGNKPLLGTNPFAFGWPRAGDAPYVFDFATSVAARGGAVRSRPARANLCPRAGRLTRTAFPRPTPRLPCKVPCCRLAGTRARPSAR